MIRKILKFITLWLISGIIGFYLIQSLTVKLKIQNKISYRQVIKDTIQGPFTFAFGAICWSIILIDSK